MNSWTISNHVVKTLANITLQVEVGIIILKKNSIFYLAENFILVWIAFQQVNELISFYYQ